MGIICNQITDTYGDFRDVGPEIPCDDRYKEGEQIAGAEFTLKTVLKTEKSPRARADWEAWQASAAAGAKTADARFEAYSAEQQKPAEQHADVSKPFLHGMCQPDGEKEKNNKELLERNCKYEETDFQLNYWFALQGDHKAQENVANCFDVLGRRPCHDVVEANATMQCAWYLVAASSGHPESAKSAEEYGYYYECDKQPLYVRQAILGTATELFQRIYHRPMPVAR